MLLQSYDPATGHAFSWNGDFTYLGILSSPPSADTLIATPSPDRLYELVGCYFLSGLRDGVYVSWSDGTSTQRVMFGDKVKRYTAICECGPICDNPEWMARSFGNELQNPIYVCPLKDELKAFGLLASAVIRGKLDRPRRVILNARNTDDLPGFESLDFDDNLDGDCVGRLARIVADGIPVVNELRKPIGISPFYGKVLTRDTRTFGKPYGFVMSVRALEQYFPHVAITTRYVASTVRVQVQNTDAFREASGWFYDTVIIHTTSDFEPDARLFLEYLHVFRGKDFVAVYDKESLPDFGSMPVIRYNRGWRKPS